MRVQLTIFCMITGRDVSNTKYSSDVLEPNERHRRVHTVAVVWTNREHIFLGLSSPIVPVLAFVSTVMNRRMPRNFISSASVTGSVLGVGSQS